MEEKGIFRSALGGFKKTDVLNYIDELTGSWNEERVQLEQQVVAEREKAEVAVSKVEAAETKANELQAVHDSLTAEIDALKEELEQLRPLAEQMEQLREEIKAANERVAVREAELAERAARIATLESTVARYEAVLGRCDNMKEHVDGIIRPFAEKASRRAEDTLDKTHALVAALLSQLGELQGGIEEQKRVLHQEKADNDARLSATLNNWFAKVKELAENTASHATHFFR